MYEAHFQLQQQPFSSVPQIDHYFPAESIEQSRRAIINSIDRQAGPLMVVGPVGTGKTMLVRLIAEQYRDQFRVVALPSARLATRKMLLQALLYELDLEYRDQDEGELRLALIDHVTSEVFCPRGVLLLIDEADSLPVMLLEELRILTNLVRQSCPCVQMVLFGTNRLEEQFNHPRLESLNQRIAGRFYLEHFSQSETIAFVQHRMSAAGRAAEDIFSEDALETVHQLTGGVPRLINQLGQHALVLATAGGVDQIDGLGFKEAWADLQQLPPPQVDPVEDAELEEVGIIEFGVLTDDEADEQDFDESDVRTELDDDTDGEAEHESRQEDQEEIVLTDAEGLLVQRPEHLIEVSQLDPSTIDPSATAETLTEEPNECGSLDQIADEDDFEDEPESREDPLTDSGHDPFEETFQEEEVVVDVQRMSAAEFSRREERTVFSDRGRELAAELDAMKDQSVTELVDIEDRQLRFDDFENECQADFTLGEATDQIKVEVQEIDPVMPEPMDEEILAAVRETQRVATSGLFDNSNSHVVEIQQESRPYFQADTESDDSYDPVNSSNMNIVDDSSAKRSKTLGQLFSRMLRN